MSRLPCHISHIILPLALLVLVGTTSVGYAVTILRDTSKRPNVNNSFRASQSAVVTLGHPRTINDVKNRPNRGVKKTKNVALSHVSAKSIIVIDEDTIYWSGMLYLKREIQEVKE